VKLVAETTRGDKEIYPIDRWIEREAAARSEVSVRGYAWRTFSPVTRGKEAMNDDELTACVVSTSGLWHLHSLRANDTSRTQCGIRIRDCWQERRLTEEDKIMWEPCLRCFPEEAGEAWDARYRAL
jgi:hypothetical protein